MASRDQQTGRSFRGSSKILAGSDSSYHLMWDSVAGGGNLKRARNEACFTTAADSWVRGYPVPTAGVAPWWAV